MTAIDDLLTRSALQSRPVTATTPPARPRLRTAIVTCMDARIDPVGLFGLRPGDAHVIRNAGGVVTDDVIRSLVISQHRLGTTEILLMQHTGCGMLTFTDEELAAELEQACGSRPAWQAGAFRDIDAEVRRSAEALLGCPYLPNTTVVRGFVVDVETGGLREVASSAQWTPQG